MRLLVALGVMLVGFGCKPAPAPAPPTPTRPPEPVQPGASTEGELAGVRYLEQMSGGARADEKVPMIVVMHPMGGDPAAMLELFRAFRGRARLIAPFGYPRGGRYFWFESARDDMTVAVVRVQTDRIAAALAALVAARPTVGKPLVTGFSQGGMMSFALAVTNPDAIAAAFPVGGLLPHALYPSAAVSSSPRPAVLPRVVAFHGADDLVVPLASARTSIAELRGAGYSAELHEFAGLAHAISPEEERELLERIARSIAAGE